MNSFNIGARRGLGLTLSIDKQFQRLGHRLPAVVFIAEQALPCVWVSLDDGLHVLKAFHSGARRLNTRTKPLGQAVGLYRGHIRDYQEHLLRPPREQGESQGLAALVRSHLSHWLSPF